MADDITYRLRHAAWTAEEGSDVEHLNIAADEIERLRRLGDAIVRLVRTDDENLWVACYEWLEARREWLEARRG